MKFAILLKSITIGLCLGASIICAVALLLSHNFMITLLSFPLETLLLWAAFWLILS